MDNSIAKEMTKRGAAGIAKATAGRSRTFRDRTKYNRKNKHKNKGDD